MSSGWTDVPLGSDRQKTPDFSHTLGSPEVTCNKSGSYVVISRVTIYQSTGNVRSAAQMRLTIDTGSGFVSSETIDDTMALIDKIKSKAGEHLAKDLTQLKKDLNNKEFLNSLNISVN